MKKLLCILTALLLVCGISAAARAESGAFPGIGSNMLGHDYINNERWAQPSHSALFENPDGTFTRVERIAEGVAVDRFSRDLEFLSGQILEAELPLYGGFYHGSTHNFLIFGQENKEERQDAEVIRVVKYTHDWVRVGSYSLLGGNTTVPFDAGGMDCAESGGILHIRTSHEMFQDEDGMHHQSNLMLSIRIQDMTPVNSLYDVFNSSYGYVSHSFNQYIEMDDSRIIAADHGDAYPRSVVLFRYPESAGMGPYYGRVEQVDVLPISGSAGSNDTGVSLGGLAVTDSSYLTVGTTMDHQGGGMAIWAHRNIFITSTPKDNFTQEATKIHYLTQLEEGDDVTLCNPWLIRVDQNRYLVLWGQVVRNSQTAYWVFVDGQGRVISDTYSSKEVILSDCQPIVANGKVIWYADSSSVPRFMTIDLSDPGTVTHQCLHSFWFGKEPTMTLTGTLELYCLLCGGEETLTVPELTSREYAVTVESEPDCNEDGVAFYSLTYPNGLQLNIRGPYGVDGHPADLLRWVEPTCTEEGYALYQCRVCGQEIRCDRVPSLGGHRYGYWTRPEEYECETMVPYYQECAQCGDRKIEERFEGHDIERYTTPSDCYDNAILYERCTHCGYESPGEDFWGDPSNGHSYGEWEPVREATCTAGGLQARYCEECGMPDFMNPSALGHSYENGICTRCGGEKGAQTEHIHSFSQSVTQPTCDEPGYINYHCSCWDADYKEPVGQPLGHRVLSFVKVYPECMTEGLRVIGCSRCDYVESSEVIPANGHTYQDGKCILCGALDHDHNYVAEVIPPQCYADGYTEHTCTGCGNTYITDRVDALGHNMVTSRQEPTCTEWGTETTSCTRCDYETSTSIPALGHAYEGEVCTRCGESHVHSFMGVETPATCTEPGLMSYSCIECGYTEEEVIPALGHTGRTQEDSPTCTEPGIRRVICDRCGEETSEELPALGHSYENGTCVRCGEADPNWVDNPFRDVAQSQYYYEPVLWALQAGVTQGVDATHFGPERDCTRAQVVTFLWRASGSPEPRRTDMPFTDVPENAYYYKSVLWALEMGITQGVSADRFGPDQACTRAQVVTFLWRAEGKPEPESQNLPFTDVERGAFYEQSVLWAVEQGITQGMGGGKFGVNGVCNRGQIVTFLYRAYQK